MLAVPNFNGNVSERKWAQSKEISGPEVMVLGRLEGFAEVADGEIDLMLIKKTS